MVSLSLDFFFSSRRRHTRSDRDWSSDVCSSDLDAELQTMARGIAGMVCQNASFNCLAAKMLITPRGFAQRASLLERLQLELSRIAPRRAYYPGAAARFAALTQGAEHVTRIG